MAGKVARPAGGKYSQATIGFAMDGKDEQLKAAMNHRKTACEAMVEANRTANDVVKYGNRRQAVTWKKR